MTEHGLIAGGWLLRWGNGRRQFGVCEIKHTRNRRTGKTTTTRTIRLSRHLALLNTDAEVRDTILHEIAHALAGTKHGHDEVWKQTCRRIGANPRRLMDDTVHTPAARYQLTCPSCRKVLANRHRVMRESHLRRAYCRWCGPDTMGKLLMTDTMQP
ncbi:MAG: hypothetical protein GC164_03455 [Phycisphaera sp.]|nr:hypothetical protein [Phycisphaera sp.]